MRARAIGFVLLLGVAGFALRSIFFPFAVTVHAFVLDDFLRIDFAPARLAWPFLLIVALVSAAVAIWNLKRGEPYDGVRLALFSAAMAAVLWAQSLAAFMLGWEAMALVSAFLVATHNARRSVRRAVFAYVLVSQLGALCITAFLALLAVHAGTGSFAGIGAAASTLTPPIRIAALTLALVGFGSKAGLVPLHFWLPRAHPAAPANASAMLSGIMLKIAVYGLLLSCFVLAAPAPASIGLALFIAGALSALFGGLYATIEREFKRLLAFSSIEHLGIIVTALGFAILALAGGRGDVAVIAVVALTFHCVNHAAFKSLLFLGAGTVSERLHVTDLDRLGGLASGPLRRSAPWMLAGCMAAAALPPLNGFVSEWLVLVSFILVLGSGSVFVKVVAVCGIVALATTGGFGAAAFVKAYGIGFLGAPRQPQTSAPEAVDASVVALAGLAALCVGIGLFPQAIIHQLVANGAQLLAVKPVGFAFEVAPLRTLALLPILGAVLALVLARRRGVREAGTWTCGSLVTPRSQYTATTLSKPLRLIFAFALFPTRERITEYGFSRWIPTGVRYVLSTRYVFDELSNSFAALVQRAARRMRVFQGGRLRVYLGYALGALLAALAIAR